MRNIIDKIENLLQTLNEDVIKAKDLSEVDNYADRNQAFLYHVTKNDGLAGIMANGTATSKNFFGFNGSCYGDGIYGTWDTTWTNQVGSYGHNLVKFIVNKRFADFLLFDKLAIDRFKKGQTVESQIKKLLTPEQVKRITACCNGDFSRYEGGYGNSSYQYSRFFGDLNRCGINVYETNIRGIGCNYGRANMVVAYYTDSLIPYQYVPNLSSHDLQNPSQVHFLPILNEEKFEAFNKNIDLVNRFKRDYPYTDEKEPVQNGVGRVVKTRVGGKANLGNYVTARTGRKMFVVDVNDPTMVGLDKTAKFKYKNVEFVMDFKDRYNVTISRPNKQGSTITLEEFNRQLSIANGITGEQEFKNQISNLSYDDFMKQSSDFTRIADKADKYKTKGNFYVYHVTGVNLKGVKNIYKNILMNSFSADFSGGACDPTLYHGLGAYTFYDFYDGAMRHLSYSNGEEPVIVKFLLKDGLKDFIIFDDTMRDAWDPGNTPYDEIVRLTDPKYLGELDKLVKGLKFNNPHEASIQHYKSKNGQPASLSFTRDGLKAFDYHRLSKDRDTNGFLSLTYKRATQGKQNLISGLSHLYTEDILAHSKARGTVYYGGHDGPCVFIRDLSSLIPVAYMFPKKDDKKWYVNDELTKDNYEHLNNNTYPFFKYRAEYPDIEYKDKTMHLGYGDGLYRHIAKVKGPNGVNYIDVQTDEKLFPIDLKDGTDIYPTTKTAIIQFKEGSNGVQLDKYTLELQNDGTFVLSPVKNPSSKAPVKKITKALYNRGYIQEEKENENENILTEAKLGPKASKESREARLRLIDVDEERVNLVKDENGNSLSLFNPEMKALLLRKQSQIANILGVSKGGLESLFDYKCLVCAKKTGRCNGKDMDDIFESLFNNGTESEACFSDPSAYAYVYRKIFDFNLPMGKNDGKDWEAIVNGQVERFHNNRDKIKKTIASHFKDMLKKNMDYSLNVYNFYAGFLKKYPDGNNITIDSYDERKKLNEEWKSVAKSDKRWNGYMNLVRHANEQYMAFRAFPNRDHMLFTIETPQMGDTCKMNDENGKPYVYLNDKGVNKRSKDFMNSKLQFYNKKLGRAYLLGSSLVVGFPIFDKKK